MDLSGTTDPQGPLADLLRGRVERVLASWGRLTPDAQPPPAATEQFLASLAALERAAEALCGEGPIDVPAAPPPSWNDLGAAKSYAHLAGLLPRALERVLRFDAAAGVVRRPDGELVVDAISHDPDLGELVRDRALQLTRVLTGGVEGAGVELPPRPRILRSSLYVPLIAQGTVVGTTYVASLQDGVFTSSDERILTDLSSHATGAFQRLEGEVRGIRATPRQSQVLALIAAGLSDKEVATRLGVSPRTVRTHLERVLREHGMNSRTEAATAWLRGERR